MKLDDKRTIGRKFLLSKIRFCSSIILNQWTNVQQRTNTKQEVKHFSPLLVVDTIGKVAYKINLPTQAQIHHKFMFLS